MKRLFWFAVLQFFSFLLLAEVRLPAIFSEHMVLQRNEPIRIWGWANVGERIKVTFADQEKVAKTNRKGEWAVELQPMSHGCGYVLTIAGKHDTLMFADVAVGDVWLCSGQSNMELLVDAVQNAALEIAAADYEQIRSFNVRREMALQPQSDFSGIWEVCSPNTVGHFSAVGYFFARKIYEETNIPIGIINSSYGGTVIEAWISPDSFKSLPYENRKNYDLNYLESQKEVYSQPIMQETIFKQAREFEQLLKDNLSLNEEWNTQENLSMWPKVQVPGLWAEPELSRIDGIVWLQYEFDLPEDVAGKSARLSLGRIDDKDQTWINGVEIGKTDAYDRLRIYDVGENILLSGKNRLSVKVTDTGGEGGFNAKENEIFLSVEGVKYPLCGSWYYKVAVSNRDFACANMTPNNYPSSLYNSMINPIIQFPIKGITWYQGESNAKNAYNYRFLFPSLISDWRNKWEKELPFYWIQLANFMQEDTIPQESEWAELREAQTMTLALPKTGQALCIDIGDTYDIHPRNKQEAGLRLAKIALHNDYGFEKLICSGPMYKSMEIQGSKVVLEFDTFGSGLKIKSKYGYLRGFSIAGADKKFHWAKAYLDGNRVVVYSDEVQQPVAVRYNWGNNPDGNLYNQAGLPACPFRTDQWQEITK